MLVVSLAELLLLPLAAGWLLLELIVGDGISPVVDNEGLEGIVSCWVFDEVPGAAVLAPSVVPAEMAVAAELRVLLDELLAMELADMPEMVTGTDEATCCD